MKPVPIPKVPRSWKRERIEATHFVYIDDETPRFGAGWRLVRLELQGHKWAHLVECGTGTKAKVELALWQKMARHGRAVGDGTSAP